MPYINVRITDDGVTPEQKLEIIQQISNTMFTVLGKDPATTFVVIDEVKTENWGVGSTSVKLLRAQRANVHAKQLDVNEPLINQPTSKTTEGAPS